VAAFDQAVEHGEMISPPAGAVGRRGDGFILRIAEKSGALVLSNDSFQEFHAERPWLFESGRLIGGKPVPGVGWIFTPRTPVRGVISRSVTSKSKRSAKAAAEALPSSTAEGSEEPTDEAPRPSRRTRTSAAGKGTTRSRSVAEGSLPVADDEPDGEVATAKPVKAAKAAKGAKAAKAAKATKESEDGKPGKAEKATKVTKAGKSAKVATATKATATKATATKATATKATKAKKATKGKQASAESAPTATPAGPGSRATPTAPPMAVDGRPRPPAEALNDPMTFLTFVADHPVGSNVRRGRSSRSPPTVPTSTSAACSATSRCGAWGTHPPTRPARCWSRGRPGRSCWCPSNRAAGVPSWPSPASSPELRPARRLGTPGARGRPRGPVTSALVRADDYLPHRDPFLFITELRSVEPGRSATGSWQLTGDEAFFAGHFPGRPTLPGVLMVESLAQLGGVAVLADPAYAGKLPLFGGIERARFRRQVVPGELLELEVTLGRMSARAGKGTGRATVGGELACQAELLFVLVDAAPLEPA
jgi:3-hydroxyacyl-[acyl-carrier-protein] dehydratase